MYDPESKLPGIVADDHGMICGELPDEPDGTTLYGIGTNGPTFDDFRAIEPEYGRLADAIEQGLGVTEEVFEA